MVQGHGAIDSDNMENRKEVDKMSHNDGVIEGTLQQVLSLMHILFLYTKEARCQIEEEKHFFSTVNCSIIIKYLKFSFRLVIQ